MLREKKLLTRVGIILICVALIGWVVLVLGQFGFLVSAHPENVVLNPLLIALMPLCGGLGFLLILVQVVIDRLASKEDDYYSKNVER